MCLPGVVAGGRGDPGAEVLGQGDGEVVAARGQPSAASAASTSLRSSSWDSISAVATWSPACNCCPSTTAPRSALTSATGTLLTSLNGFQNAHRYIAPYSSGSRMTVTIAIRGSAPRLNRLISVPSDIPASTVTGLPSIGRRARSGTHWPRDLRMYVVTGQFVDRAGDHGLRPAQVDQPLHQHIAVFVAGHLVEVADHQEFGGVDVGHRDAQQHVVQLADLADVLVQRRHRQLTEHRAADPLLHLFVGPRHQSVPRRIPPHLFGEQIPHGHRFVDIVQLTDTGQRAVGEDLGGPGPAENAEVCRPRDASGRPGSVAERSGRSWPAQQHGTPPSSMSRSTGPYTGPHGPFTRIPRATMATAGCSAPITESTGPGVFSAWPLRTAGSSVGSPTR